LEQARIDQALAADQISSVNVLQPATYLAQPVAPKKRLVVALGALIGAVGALAVAVAAEYSNRTIQTEADVERHLALPVFLSLPRSSVMARVMR
jgi:capsular polysaccharide biosynthesis protein